MDYIQGLSAQTEIFLLSLGFGFLLGILYDIFRTLRLIISGSSGFTVFMDVLYFVMCGFLVFFFNLIVDDGKIRLYVLSGDLLGWLIYYFSLGEISIRISNRIISLSRRITKAFLKPFLYVVYRIKRKNRNCFVYFQKIIKKVNKKSKFNLQKYKGMVYNLNGYKENNKSKEN